MHTVRVILEMDELDAKGLSKLLDDNHYIRIAWNNTYEYYPATIVKIGTLPDEN